MLSFASKIRRWGCWLCLCVALGLAQGCVNADSPEAPPSRAEGQRLKVAEHQAAEESQKADVARQKAEAQQVRAEAEAQKVAAQKARRDAAQADAQAKKVAAEEAKQRAMAEKQAAEQARQAEIARVQAEKQKAREQAARTAEKAKQRSLAEKQAAEKARQAESERIRAEKLQARADASAKKNAEKEAAEALKARAQLPPETLAVPTAPSDYVLRAGDEIDIQVYREPELSGNFKIAPSGDIRHSLAGAIPLAGKTVSEAESFFTKRLAKDYLVNPRVIIKMVSTQSSQIVVLGEVKNPGVYPLPVGDSMTLLQAIAGAGGFTELASPERVRIVRKTPDGGQTTLRVRVSSLLAGKGREQDVPLEPNDVIMVPDVVF